MKNTPQLKSFSLNLREYGELEGKYIAKANWRVGDFNFEHTISARVSALIFEVCKGQICAESTKALDEMIKQVKESNSDVEEITPE